MTAVVDASFREEEDEEEDEEETEGLGGVVSDAAALEMYLRLESGKQRECVETFVSEEAREKTLSATSVVDVEERRGDEKNGNETITKSMKLREAERAADILRTHGLVFLKSVVPEETCDEILADLNAICDECKETYGDALRRTDVLLGVGDDNGDDSGDGKINGVKKALEFACKEEGGREGQEGELRRAGQGRGGDDAGCDGRSDGSPSELACGGPSAHDQVPHRRRARRAALRLR